MAIDRNELKKKVMEAAGAEEIMEIMKAAGEEITAEEAERFYEKVQDKKTDRELSLDELEAVAGGEDRDWLRDGCAATVEAGSDCYGTDMCGLWPVTYEHRPTRHKCSVCGGILYSNGSTGGGFFEEEVYHYKCASCGAQFKTHGGELIKYSK
jgi:hypothetical protein